jgi:putative tryptophan/tyrosine transport system substrate-binding protein
VVTRRAFLQRSAAIGAGALFGACVANAPVAKPIPRVGILSLVPTNLLFETFVAGLAELGYERGRNIEVEGRWNDNTDHDARGARAFAELLVIGVDVILAYGNVAARSAKALTTKIPIVIVGPDAIETGLVSDLARPGGNLTGVSVDHSATVAKCVELLKEAFPYVSRVAITSDIDPERRRLRRVVEAAARAVGLETITVEASTPDDMPTALAVAADQSPDALLSLTVAASYSSHERAFAAARRIPAMHTSTEAAVDNGTLMAYLPDGHHLMRRAASYVVRILNGERPSDLPMERPTKFVFVINLKTARAQGLTIAPSVLIRATRVIE